MFSCEGGITRESPRTGDGRGKTTGRADNLEMNGRKKRTNK